DPLGILNTLDRYEVQDIDNKKAEAKIVKELFLNALNQLIVEYQIKQVRTSYKFFRNDEILDLKHLSEGYRAVILLITDILIRVLSLRPTKLEEIQSKEKSFVLENVLEDTRGTILIDEFNRHLHPQWQRRFIDDLQRVLPNVQFVLTTHSPIAVLGREEDEVQVLEFNADGEIEIKKHEGGTKNLDVSLILLKYFGLESVVSPELQEKIDKYYELQINGETDETLEKELEAANLGIPIYDTRYLKFLEFLKKRNIDIRDMERIEDIEVNNEEWDELENELAELLD
ncbi:MAG: putative ATP-binding protein involved in virulence, partial [Cognaticolwellia sp.]